MFSAFLSSLLGCKVAQLCINCFGVVLLDVFYLWGSVAILDGTEEFWSAPLCMFTVTAWWKLTVFCWFVGFLSPVPVRVSLYYQWF